MATRALIAALLTTAAGLACSQPPAAPPGGPPATAPGAEWRQGGMRERLRGGMGLRGDHMTTEGPMAGMRLAIQAELRHVPTLEEKWRAMQQIQQERMALAQQRESIARSGPGSDRDQLSKFHDTLMAEDRLTSRMEELGRQFAADAAKIQAQVLERRKELQAQLDKAAHDAPGGADALETTRHLRAALRMYELVLDRLDDLEDNPRPASLLRYFSKVMWSPGELDPAMVEQARRRLQQLEQDQDEIRRQLDTLQGQITELKELLDIAGSLRRQPGTPGGEGARGRMRGPRRVGAPDTPEAPPPPGAPAVQPPAPPTGN